MATALEKSNIGPDFFGLYTSEVAELLSQDDGCMPSSPQISGLAGNLLELDREKGTSRNSCTKKEDNSNSDSASLYTNGIGSLLPEIKKERLKSLLCQSVLTLGKEVDEMINPVLSICRIRSCLRYKNSLLSLDGSGCEVDQVDHPQKKLKVSHPSLIDDDLHYILESDSTKVEELMKKYSDELSTVICRMEQKLEELLDIVMSSCRSMTLMEKQQLRKLIQSLPPGNLDRVTEVIRRHNSSDNTSCDEVHVDLDDEDSVTLWRLYYYVTAIENARTLCED